MASSSTFRQHREAANRALAMASSSTFGQHREAANRALAMASSSALGHRPEVKAGRALLMAGLSTFGPQDSLKRAVAMASSSALGHRPEVLIEALRMVAASAPTSAEQAEPIAELTELAGVVVSPEAAAAALAALWFAYLLGAWLDYANAYGVSLDWANRFALVDDAGLLVGSPIALYGVLLKAFRRFGE